MDAGGTKVSPSSYALVFNLAAAEFLLAACTLYLTGALSLSWALTLLVATFMIYGELISANNSAFLTKKIEGGSAALTRNARCQKQDLTDETA